VSFLRLKGGVDALPSKVLRSMDPLLYAAMVVVAFVPRGTFALTPLQLAGMATGAVFLVGLCFVWLAFAEPEDDDSSTAEPVAADPAPATPGPDSTRP
jgi:hypothetical protein